MSINSVLCDYGVGLLSPIAFFKILDKGNKKAWTVDMKKSPPYIGTESTEKVDVELILKDSDFIQISAGKLKPDQAFMQGKMKIKGNIMKAMKLKTILDPSQLKAKL